MWSFVIASLCGRIFINLGCCAHWVMVGFVANHHTTKAFYVLAVSMWESGAMQTFVQALRISPSIRLLACSQASPPFFFSAISSIREYAS